MSDPFFEIDSLSGFTPGGVASILGAAWNVWLVETHRVVFGVQLAQKLHRVNEATMEPWAFPAFILPMYQVAKSLHVAPDFTAPDPSDEETHSVLLRMNAAAMTGNASLLEDVFEGPYRSLPTKGRKFVRVTISRLAGALLKVGMEKAWDLVCGRVRLPLPEAIVYVRWLIDHRGLTCSAEFATELLDRLERRVVATPTPTTAAPPRKRVGRPRLADKDATIAAIERTVEEVSPRLRGAHFVLAPLQGEFPENDRPTKAELKKTKERLRKRESRSRDQRTK